MNTTDQVVNLRELRMRLVDVARALRDAKDDHEKIQARCEQQAILAGAAGGKNAEERARALTIALASDDSYQLALTQVRRCEYEKERIEALLECARDERRAAEWQIRLKLADGLWRTGISTESTDDTAFDDSADEWTVQGTIRRGSVDEVDIPF